MRGGRLFGTWQSVNRLSSAWRSIWHTRANQVVFRYRERHLQSLQCFLIERVLSLQTRNAGCGVRLIAINDIYQTWHKGKVAGGKLVGLDEFPMGVA